MNVFGPRIEIDERSPEVMLKEAVDLAKTSDVVVAVVGEATEMSGEAASRTDLSIPESQKKLIKALVDTGKPVALVLMSGRPAPENEEFQKFKSNYLDSSNSPLLSFGYGLSYTTFEYSNLRLDKTTTGQNETISATVTVTNTGDYDGEEVVQLYLRDVVRSITPPKRELKGFQKIGLKKGERKEVTITLSPDDLKFYNSQLDFVAEPGEFEIFVGTDSDAQLSKTFTLK